jgi:hypothetical protein
VTETDCIHSDPAKYFNSFIDHPWNMNVMEGFDDLGKQIGGLGENVAFRPLAKAKNMIGNESRRG